MATLREYRSDIELLSQKLKLSRDSRLAVRQIEFQIAKYRALGIRQDFKRNMEIDFSWIQDFGVVPFTPVNSADDPAIFSTSLALSKFTIPSVVSLPEDRGVYRVAGASKEKRYYPISPERFFELVPGSPRANQDYYFRVGNSLYIKDRENNVVDMANVALIIDDPMDGFKFNTEFILSGNLVIGNSYTVTYGQIVSNSVTYNVNQTFTAAATTFTGNGQVMAVGEKVMMTIDDQYPMSHTMFDFIIMKIFTQDYKIEASTVASVRNDGTDEALQMQNERGT